MQKKQVAVFDIEDLKGTDEDCDLDPASIPDGGKPFFVLSTHRLTVSKAVGP